MPFLPVQTIRSAISRTRHFFLTGLWSAQLDALPKRKSLPARFLRAVTLAVVEFFKDGCMLRASALTFYTLLSIVPIFAVMFGIANRRTSFPTRPVGLHRVSGGGANYNAIYGSFAALPLFFVWVQTSWTLVLFGAELCYAFQNADTYCSATGNPVLRPHEKRLLSLAIARLVIQDFAAGQAPLTVPQMSQRLRVPARLAQELVDELRQSDIFTETRTRKGRKPAFQPATDIDRLDVQRVIEAIALAGAPEKEMLLPTADSATIAVAIRELNRAAAQSSANRLLKDL
ncbi:MAG TPA: YhjD/YihY/BrkB family envelope integrity protein [Desulfobacterales bacterium]|nr:YhjD/YihY/BrkB family envelope integrity protein [Desulfobacterales bacterium]